MYGVFLFGGNFAFTGWLFHWWNNTHLCFKQGGVSEKNREYQYGAPMRCTGQLTVQLHYLNGKITQAPN